MAQRRDDDLETPENVWRARQARRQAANNEDPRKGKEGRRNSSQNDLNGSHHQNPNHVNRGKSRQNRSKKNKQRPADQAPSRGLEAVEAQGMNQGILFLTFKTTDSRYQLKMQAVCIYHIHIFRKCLSRMQ